MLSVLLSMLTISIVANLASADFMNDRPIIGVLAQEPPYYLNPKNFEENYSSYIAASYVKSIEAAGARVVPIMIGKPRLYYENVMSKINGVLFPGGDVSFNQSNGYADAGQHIYEIAQELNDAGHYFPIFGTCLGFELIVILASGRENPDKRVTCHSFSNLPLNFTDDFKSSKMFRDVPEKVIDLLKTKNITVNAHGFCVLDENLALYNLTRDWRVTSYSNDDFGVKFIASLEHKRYPFYGVQFHPEKSSFEWKLSRGYSHSMDAVRSNRYFMDFFVMEARKSNHTFESEAEENKYLIYNYMPYFTGVFGMMFEQCYFFEPRGVISSTFTNHRMLNKISSWFDNFSNFT